MIKTPYTIMKKVREKELSDILLGKKPKPELSVEENLKQTEQLSKLIVEETFKVKKIIKQDKHVFNEPNKIKFQTTSYLTVESESKNVNTTKLQFEGRADVYVGDKIKVKMPLFNVYVKHEKPTDYVFGKSAYNIYIKRNNFNNLENAIEITKINDKGKELSIDRAINYDRFYVTE